MALVGPTLLTADPDTANVASYATPSVSPTAGALIVVGVVNTDATNAIQPTLSAAFSVVGSTWAMEASAQNSTAVERVTLFSAVATGSPGSGAITADFGGDAQTGCTIIAVEYTGQDTTDPVLQPEANGHPGGAGVTSHTVTLGSSLASANNQILAFIYHGVAEGQTAAGGGTELASSDVNYATPAMALAAYSEVGDNSVGATWTTAGRAGSLACEIVEATAGGHVTVTPDVGAVALSGVVPVTSVAALAGTVALTILGLAPVASVRAAAGVGTVTIVGLEPTVSIGGGHVTVTPDVGTITVAGLAPTVSTTAPAGTTQGTITGLAPTLRFAAAPGVGAITLVGFAPTITDFAVADPCVLTFTPSGTATLTMTPIVVLLGSYPGAGTFPGSATYPGLGSGDAILFTPATDGSLSFEPVECC